MSTYDAAGQSPVPSVAGPVLTPAASAAPRDTGVVITAIPTRVVVGDLATPDPATAVPLFPDVGVSRNAWTVARLNTVRDIYGISDAGYAWMESYDFRQMIGQPAWFGSYGVSGWAGGGEAIPRIIGHEFSHSYWGAFPVDGRPDLPTARAGGDPDRLLGAYRSDLDRFMRQPPDRYEPLRARFRNMPNLVKGDYPDLWHSGEADILNFTGGNVLLLPPILRKYWSHFLGPYGLMGDNPDALGKPVVQDWAGAIAWHRGLREDDRRTAEQVFGLQHFPLNGYTVRPMTGASLDPEIISAISGEDRQRLLDFFQQFDLTRSQAFALVDAAGVDRGFSFWKSYLSDIRGLHRTYPEVLSSMSNERAHLLVGALDFYISIERLSAAAQVSEYLRRADEADIREMAVLLKARAIITLFASVSPGSEGVGSVLGHYAKKLALVAASVDDVIESSRTSSDAGAASIERYITSLTDDELRADSGIFFEMLRESDGELIGRLMPRLSDAVILRLLRIQPALARSGEIGTTRLLAAIGVHGEADIAGIGAAAKLLADNTSGNFAIDLPVELAIFDAVERLSSEPEAALIAVRESGAPIEPWLDRGSDVMLSMFRAAPKEAARLIASGSGLPYAVQSRLHKLISRDPELAARLTLLVSEQRQGVGDSANVGPGEAALVLLELAYDSYWRREGGPSADPSSTAAFLFQLDSLRPGDWLNAQHGVALAEAREWTAAGEVDSEFEEQLRNSLADAASAALSAEARAVTQRLLAH